jgi:alkylhydroperoxidase family enzyme
MTYDAAARMKKVLGSPPRLEPLADADMGEREWAAIRQLRKIVGFPEEGPAPAIFATLCRHPDLFLSFVTPGIQFMTVSSLPDRDRELAILRTGWLCGAPFEFGEHVSRAKQAGVTPDEIERVTQGSSAGWEGRDRLILLAAEELHADAMISDDTWAGLVEHLDERQLIELPMLVGHYHKAAFVQNSLRFRLNEHNTQGLAAR